MATPTSSSNRSKRKTNKPVTKGQEPQRSNRQKVSKAQVSNSETRGSNAGSAKVTTGRGASAPKPADPWKAPTTKNSRTSAPKSNTTFRTQNTPLTLPNSRAQGKNLPRAAAQQLRSTTQGPRPSGKPPAKPSGNFKAPSIPKPKPAAPKPNALARNLRFGRGNVAAMALGAANAADDARLTPAQRAKKYEVVNPDRGQNLLTKLQSGTLGKSNNSVKRDPNGRSSTGVRVSDKTNQRDYKAAPTGSQQYNNYRNQQLSAERERLKGVGNSSKAPAPSAPSRAAGTQSSTRSSAAPLRPSSTPRSSAPAAPKERRVSAATANRESGNYGTSRTNNPLMKDLTDRMRQREDREGVGPMRDGARYAADVKNTTQGVGPIKDGPTYGSNLQKAIDDLKRRKKEQDAKKK